MRNTALQSAIGLCILVLAGIFSVQLNQPPEVQNRNSPVTGFSAERAHDHLKIIAAHPHSAGTAYHDSVRYYISRYCQEAGYQVEIQDTVGARVAANGRVMVAGKVRNIVATLKGTGNKPENILVMAHYDSEPNTPGATDDGSGVSAMLETIRALKASALLQHDITFLFTDMEEAGLLGAEAFVNLYPQKYTNTIVLNYESRGNKGAAIAFEVTEQNGWMVKQFSTGAPFPLLNSLTYEIYKRLPNNTDFTLFKRKEYTGINQANIGGHVNYHSMTDTYQRADLQTIQHHGSNMLGMIRHLDTQNLSNTKAPDITYFNPVGYWFLSYSSTLNLPLVIGCFILFIILIYHLKKNEQIKFWNVVKTAGVFLLAIVVSLAGVFAVTKLVLMGYPHYANFYNHDFYNSAWYLHAFIGVTVLIFVLAFSTLLRALTAGERLTGVMVVVLFMIALLYHFLPSGSFLLYYPVTVFLIINLIGAQFKTKNAWQPIVYSIALLPAILLLVPMANMFFVTFTLALPYGALLVITILIGMAVPLLVNLQKYSVYLCLGSIVYTIVGLSGAHINSKITVEQPLRVSLNYFFDADANKSYWFSTDRYKSDWLSHYVDSLSNEVALSPGESSGKNYAGAALGKNLLPSRVTRSIDTLATGEFMNVITVAPQQEAINYRMFTEGIEGSIRLNGRQEDWNLTKSSEPHVMFVRPLGKNGFTLSFKSAEIKPIKVLLIERSYGLPAEWLDVPKPDDIIWNTGDNANAVFIKQRVTL
ncbi:MAG TPA: M20/M25/M40 family metallo-hydrolase [Cyclobacteriaceae bacterium]|jgi:hypothetical protein|nr:M20/M25/M40 family metallo-hydrolase [Cytophagales bacterium]HRE68198.1 M20/M25/M40 family metallo-hydrolase [Cyclobacteriaceae bacterium]HRF33648.1 M20/M25/M40 family metallo-hydrolase [Cyclobacteriaceae bacterium]